MLSDAISRDFADHLELIPSTMGLHLTALVRTMSEEQMAAIARRAAERSVAINVLSFAEGASPRTGVLLGYGAIPTAHIEEGLRLLRACFEERTVASKAKGGRRLQVKSGSALSKSV
jgi:GntR family transcriptional regulator / MocR family aminotransferase